MARPRAAAVAEWLVRCPLGRLRTTAALISGESFLEVDFVAHRVVVPLCVFAAAGVNVVLCFRGGLLVFSSP